jgi:stage II sporulation protein D
MQFNCNMKHIFLLLLIMCVHGYTHAGLLVMREPIAAEKVWHIRSPDGFCIYGSQKPAQKKCIKDAKLDISIDAAGHIVLNHQLTTKQHAIVLVPQHDDCAVQEVACHGFLLIAAHDNHLYVLQYDALTCKEPASIFSRYERDIHNIKSAKKEERASSDEKASSYNVRVLLDERASFDGNPWILTSDNGFMLVDPHDNAHRLILDDKQLRIHTHKGLLYINNKKSVSPRVYIVPKKGHISFDNKQYLGGFLVQPYDGKTVLINNLDLEDYVYCVLKSESWPGWPLEVNKVFAVACRTYAIAMVKRSKQSKLPYHIKNTKIHQVYDGFHTSEILKNAVDQTKWLFLSYKGEPILAMFDSCCGGVITAKIKGVDFNKAPYLARDYPCTHCKPCKPYNWHKQWSTDELIALLKPAFPSLKKIKQIKIHKKDGAGLVQEVIIQGAKKNFHVSGKKLYALLSQHGLKSFCFSVSKEGDSFIFKGRGLGHHMGLCQWGAREMVRKGFDFKAILQFYYPNTLFMRLQ